MEPVSDVLFSLFRGSPQRQEWVLACLQGSWSGIVGETLARVSSPTSFTGSALVVTVQDPAWKKALESMREAVLAKIRQVTGGEVRSVSFVLSRSA